MLNGFYLIYTGTTTDKYYSPEFGRGALTGLFALDVKLMSGSPTLVVAVEHKNADEVGWSEAGTFSNITSTGIATKEQGNLKEQLRFRFNFSAGSAGNFFYVNMLAPQWITE